jgi:hypothetical protein
MQQCMAEKGWDVEVLPDGGIVSDVPPEQISQRNQAMGECAKQHGDAGPQPPPSEEEYRQAYRELLKTAECLQAEGFEVDPAPSEDAFVESQGAIWSPYDTITPQSEREWLELNAKCPQP